MRLSELLSPSRIRVPLRAKDKEGVLRELVDLLVQQDGGAAGRPVGSVAAGEVGELGIEWHCSAKS